MKQNVLRALTMAILCLSSGCVKGMMVDGQIKATREAAPAIDTLGDYDVARAAAQSGLAQFEGMHRLRPENTDGLFMLMKGWAGYGFAFAQDDFEEAQSKDLEDEAESHKVRAKHAYDRAIGYGLELLARYDGGFEGARKREAPLKAWLAEHFKDRDDGQVLYWFGTAWMLRVSLLREDPAHVATLFVAACFLERARALDEPYNFYGAATNLGAYHARNAAAELDESRALFEEALKKSGGKALMVHLNYATRYACIKGDRPLFDRLIHEIETQADPDASLGTGKPAGPDAALRLTNTIAKRKAKRAKGKAFVDECGFR